MKINEINPHIKVDNSARTNRAASDQDFKSILTNRLHNMATAVNQGEDVSPIAPEQAAASLRLESLALGEITINTLDAYQMALGRTDIKTAALEPFISSLEDNNQTLIDLQKQLPKDDHLAILLEQIAAVSYMETVKYRRGDY